jgi:pyruvate dehydrogenase E2 component (dihydrolipoamide acetyltransferase)
MAHGNIIEWKVKEGQEIAPGDELADIETDKATLSWENQDDGFIARILAPDGSKDVPIGTPLAVLVEEEGSRAAFKDFKVSSSEGEGEVRAAAASFSSSSADAGSSIKSAASTQNSSSGGSAIKADPDRVGPAVRKLLKEHGFSVNDITPTGPRNILTKGDVLQAAVSGVKPGVASSPSEPSGGAPTAAVPQQKQQPSPKGSPKETKPKYIDIPNSQIRKIIAQRLLHSKETIPHLYLTANINLQPVTKLREQMKKKGEKASVNDFIIRAAAKALATVPGANAAWDTNAEEIKLLKDVDVCVAVATEGGLMTPIVKNADQKPLMQVSADVKDLATRARANKLKPEEFQGGSFSISNLGMFGIDEFYAIINPPQAAIMAVGGARQVALPGIVGSSGNSKKGGGGGPVVGTQMTVTLSADGRVFDGEVAAEFLNTFSDGMENPKGLL